MRAARLLAALILVAVVGLAACGGSTVKVGDTGRSSSPAPTTLRIALLHLAPASGDLAANTTLIAGAVEEAAARGADWCVTPELALSGYYFRDRIGLRWIGPRWKSHAAVLSRLARDNDVALFAGMPTRDGAPRRLHNSVLVVDRSGSVLGAYHKRSVIPGTVEGWAAPGRAPGVFDVDGVAAGVLICADAWPRRFARETAAAGAQILVSPACWAPGEMGPNGVWERDSRLTGLPLLVCNTTGRVKGGDDRRAASVVDDHGRRLLTFRSPTSEVFLVDWDRQAGTFASAGSFTPAAAR